MIATGSQVQYRKVGRGVVQGHACPAAGYDCSAYRGTGGQHLYDVAFETGRNRGTVRQVWVRDSEVIAGPAAPVPAAAGPAWLDMSPGDFDTEAPAVQLAMFPGDGTGMMV
jgi:hypothetical protein